MIKAPTPSGTPKRCTFSVIDLMFSSSLARSCWIFRSSFLLAPPLHPHETSSLLFSSAYPTSNESNAKGMKGSSRGTHQEPIQRVPKEKQSCTWDVFNCFPKKDTQINSFVGVQNHQPANLNRWLLIVSIHDWTKTFEYLNIPEATLASWRCCCSRAMSFNFFLGWLTVGSASFPKSEQCGITSNSYHFPTHKTIFLVFLTKKWFKT